MSNEDKNHDFQYQSDHYLNKDVFEGYQRLYDERFSNDAKKIEKLEETQTQLQELSIQMGELLKSLSKATEANTKDINDIKKKPTKIVDTIVSTLITVILSGAISTAISFLLK